MGLWAVLATADDEPRGVLPCPLPAPLPPLNCEGPLQDTQCLGASSLTCLPTLVLVNPTDGTVGPTVQSCACFDTSRCGGIHVNDTILSCQPAECPVPPYSPTDFCQVFLNGVPTGQISIDLNTLTGPDVHVTCDCFSDGIVLGACCDANGFCIETSQNNCLPPNIWLGAGTPCGPIGACCFGETSCSIMNKACCDAQGGAFAGPGTLCDFGKCCKPDGTCVMAPQACCDGTWHTGDCFPPLPCCLPDGSCLDMDRDCCLDLNGTVLAAGTACAGSIQACCIQDAAGGVTCVDADAQCCTDLLGGVPQGAGTVCLGDANGNGIDDACEDPMECIPSLVVPTECNQHLCEVPGEECVPVCAHYSYATGSWVIQCDCRDVSQECYVEVFTGQEPLCTPCPPGQVCEETYISTPDGYVLCCDCAQLPNKCEPNQSQTACEPYICPVANEQCLPRCVQVDPLGNTTVIDCDCRGAEDCHVVYDASIEPFCDGTCPPGQVCIDNFIVLADGTLELCCDCVEQPCICPGDINGDGIIDGLDIPGFVRCLLGMSLPGDNCGCADIDGNGLDMNDISLFVATILSKPVCFPTPCCPEKDLAIDLTSGVDSGGGFIPVGGDDEHWIVTVDPSGGVVPRPAEVITPNPAWLTIPGSQWIAANPTGPNGYYTYQFCFCLDPRFQNARLLLDLRADDNAEVYLNGTLVGVTPPQSFNSPLPTHIDVNAQALFKEGENCVEVIVRNQYGVVTGLNIAGGVTADAGKCCCDARDLLESFDTGVFDGGGLIPTGTDDDTWDITVDPSGGAVPRPATVVTAHPAWLTIPGTKWISNNATKNGPNGYYTYRFCFCLDPRFKNAVFELFLRADDNATVWLNGTQIGDTGPQSFNTPNPEHIIVTDQTLFVPCENCIEVVVRNQFGVVTGLNLAGTIQAIDGKCCDNECAPAPDGQTCEQTECPTPGESCKPTCVNFFQGVTTITDCNCGGKQDCHVEIVPGTVPFCMGDCPPGFTCVSTWTPNPTGGDDLCCDCVPDEPTGACCLDSGICFVTTPSDCQSAGGLYMGDGSVCGGIQACCFPGEAGWLCLNVDVACCTQLYGGAPQGAGTFCLGDNDLNGTDDACEQPQEQFSCCDAQGQCVDLAPGVTQCGSGWTLVPGPCGALQACCFPTGGCSDLFEACCLAQGGAPQGAGTDCTTVQCPPDPGCGTNPLTGLCLPIVCPGWADGDKCRPSCVIYDPTTGVFTADDCQCRAIDACYISIDPASPFSFQCVGGCAVAGETCNTISTILPDGTERICCECLPGEPTGACCEAQGGGVCFITTASACPPAVGTYLGDGTACGGIEACCYNDPQGTGIICADIDSVCCALDFGGVPQGPGSTCATTSCLPDQDCGPDPLTGACQIIPGACTSPERCMPTCVIYDPVTGVFTALDCECRLNDECHLEISAITPFTYSCQGTSCTGATTCSTTLTVLPDGREMHCCQCQ